MGVDQPVESLDQLVLVVDDLAGGGRIAFDGGEAAE